MGAWPLMIFSISSSGLLMPSETGTRRTDFPSNRARSTFLSAAMMMPSQAAISSRVRMFLAPPEPCVSALTPMFSSRSFFSRASAAIYVWAMPVGQAVTASTRRPS